jgi:hypothetical protein
MREFIVMFSCIGSFLYFVARYTLDTDQMASN